MTKGFDAIETVVKDLIDNFKNEQAEELLQFYSTKAKSLSEFERIGQLALKHNFSDIAVKCAETVYNLSDTSQQLYIARTNLYKAYYTANEIYKALFYVKLNLSMTPNDFETILCYAEYLKASGDRVLSESIIDNLKQRQDLTPKQIETLYVSDSHRSLRQGKTALGIQKYLHTDKDKTTVFDINNVKRWNGVTYPNTKIYINSEGGIGDIFINMRFFNTLKDYGMKPILFSNLERSDVDNVLRRNGFEVINETFSIDKKSTWDYLMQLPISLNVSEKDLWKGPYLKAKNDPKNDLGKKTKFRIGIKCDGNKYFMREKYRKIPIENILSILPENIEIYYFDVEKTHDNIINLKDKIRNWDDTLDYLSQMDLVISSCTSIAHASGAMGISTIVYSPLIEYYTWTSTRTDNTTPWYGDNFFVFKQTTPKCWNEPLQQSLSHINKIMNGHYTMETL